MADQFGVKPRLLALAIAALVAIAAVSAFRLTRPVARQVVVTRRLLTKLPESARKNTIAVGDDGSDFAYVNRVGNKQQVIRTGAPGPFYDDLSPPLLARGTHKLFYWAVDHSSTPSSLVLAVDGDRIETGLTRMAQIVLSRNGARWALAGRIPEVKVGDRVEPGGVVVFVDGKLVGRHRDATTPAFSVDGRHVAYIARADDGHFTLFVDGQSTRTFEEPGVTSAPVDPAPGLPQFRVLYLSDGSLLMLTRDRDGWVLYRDEHKLGSFGNSIGRGQTVVNFSGEAAGGGSILADSITAAEDAPSVSWWEQMGGPSDLGWRVMRDGKALEANCALSWESAPPLFSRDGQHLGYPCWLTPPGPTPGVIRVVADHRSYGPYGNVWGMAFADDGRQLAYAAATASQAKESWSYYIDGKSFSIKYDEVWRPRFSPDGAHLAWEAKRAKRSILVLDGDSLYSYDDVLWGPEFQFANHVSWVVRRGPRLVRVDAAY